MFLPRIRRFFTQKKRNFPGENTENYFLFYLSPAAEPCSNPQATVFKMKKICDFVFLFFIRSYV
jgi:hypothetical protein